MCIRDSLGVEIRGRLYDTMILHYLLDPESRHNMDALAMRYLDVYKRQAEGRAEVLHQGHHAGLVFGGEELLDVHFAYGLAQGAVGKDVYKRQAYSSAPG